MKITYNAKMKLLAAVFAAVFILLLNNINVDLSANAYAISFERPADIKNISVRLRYGDKTWEYRYPEIVCATDIDREFEGKFEKDFRGRIKRQTAPFNAKFLLADAKEKISEIAKAIDTPPENAQVTFYPDSDEKFEIIKDIKGKKLNSEKLLKFINAELLRGRSVDAELIPEDDEAKITEASLKRSFFVRAQFSTSFAGSSTERKHNIALSLSQFNGMIVPPEKEISFNKTVGSRTEQRGYKTAKIIVGGDFIEGLGGGVCQTSTTIYNSMLLADIKISEYHNHTLTVSYVPPSFDAMVNISTSDLKFKNDSGNFLYLKTWTQGDRAYVRVYGEKLGYTIERKSTVTKTYETPKEKLIVDTEGKYTDIYQGERVIVFRSKPKTESTGQLLYYRNGVLFKTKLLRKDVYSQFIGKEVIGTAKRPPV